MTTYYQIREPRSRYRERCVIPYKKLYQVTFRDESNINYEELELWKGLIQLAILDEEGPLIIEMSNQESKWIYKDMVPVNSIKGSFDQALR
jgi:hypothetical protein